MIYIEFSFPNGFHDVCRRTLVHQLLLHEIHVGGYVLEELPVAGAEVVQSGFTVCCMCKAILRTFAVAGKQPFALPALGGGETFASSVRRLADVRCTSFPLVFSDRCFLACIPEIQRWSQAYTSPLNSITPACPQVFAMEHTPGCSPTQLARVESKSWM